MRPSDQTQLRSLTSIVQKYKLDFISKASVGRNAVVLVKPQYNDVFLRELADQKIVYTVHVNDVKAWVFLEFFLSFFDGQSTADWFVIQ